MLLSRRGGSVISIEVRQCTMPRSATSSRFVPVTCTISDDVAPILRSVSRYSMFMTFAGPGALFHRRIPPVQNPPPPAYRRIDSVGQEMGI